MSSRAVSDSYPTKGFIWHILAMVLTLIPISSLGENVWTGTAMRGGGEPRLLGR